MLSDYLEKMMVGSCCVGINELDIDEISLLMKLPGFTSEDGLKGGIFDVSMITDKGFRVDDKVVSGMFAKRYLKWVVENRQFSVNEGLLGKSNKDAIVERFVNLSRGGDGSEAFESFFRG